MSNIVIPDGGNIGSASDTDAISISSGGVTTFSQNIDISGKELILDSDNDTSITADTDDQIDFKTAGSDRLVINSAGDVFSVAWTDYSSSSTLTGWASSGLTKVVYYKRIGKLIFVAFFISGTSNATSASFTLPFTSKNITSLKFGSSFYIGDDGGTSQNFGSASGEFYTGSTSPNSSSFTLSQGGSTSGWDNSGSKTIGGSFFYEAESI